MLVLGILNELGMEGSELRRTPAGKLKSLKRCFLQAKILVFASTCKQVKFMFEAFSRLRPGCPLRCLHGGMKQMKRMAVFYDFSEVTSQQQNPPIL